MESSLGELERRQTQILQRITQLELSHLPQHFSASLSLSPPNENAAATNTTESRLSAILGSNGVRDFSFRRVPSDYYDSPLESRRDVLGASSVHHLCKSIVLVDCGLVMTIDVDMLIVYSNRFVRCKFSNSSPKSQVAIGEIGFGQGMEYGYYISVTATVYHTCALGVRVNTQAPSNVTDCSDHNYSKYYVVVVQYTARFNAETVKNFLYALNDGRIPKKKFNLRLAPEEISQKLTGYEHNAVTCVGMKTDIPVILDEAIVKLNPEFFWLGGGEVDLKLGIRTSEFVNFVKPFIVSCSGA
ncbi:hypothetical protein RHSIM_Rhsim07G0106500 [Rhododendron simsii]|uniref:YbaK/aminoacyl-tRNA synthetase-associated domain-containing protein n=1 Tax=Rhododendron simsii TaxID=118357 RepID=A0A834GKN5_RHOSS|nr:hypothetical protein RHSIM_Rhsim07G0106500 [Rhododendron simsii]